MSMRRERSKGRLCAEFEAMVDELVDWRERHPGASLDEIGHEITPRRRKLMGKLMVELGRQEGGGAVWEGVVCRRCGEMMVHKGEAKREVEHMEGAGELRRAYYHCPHCGEGIFPPGSTTEVSGSSVDAGDD